MSCLAGRPHPEPASEKLFEKEEVVKSSSPLLFVIILIAGIVVGFVARDIMFRMNAGKGRNNFVELREGQSKLINLGEHSDENGVQLHDCGIVYLSQASLSALCHVQRSQL